MVTPTNSNERLTFEEIMEKYPDQWVGLTDVDLENNIDIKSAVVKYTGDMDDLLMMEVCGHVQDAIFTTPDQTYDKLMVGFLGDVITI